MGNTGGSTEACLAGFGFGAFMGGAVLGAGVDLLGAPVNTMAAYFVGALLGGFAGMIAGRLAGAFLLR